MIKLTHCIIPHSQTCNLHKYAPEMSAPEMSRYVHKKGQAT